VRYIPVTMNPGRVAAREPSRDTVCAIVCALKLVLLCASVWAGLSLPGVLHPVRAAEPLRSVTPHDHFRRPEACPHCHIVSGNIAAPGLFSADSERFCLGCHLMESLGRSHPVNVAPRERIPPMTIPKALPLSTDGRLMCLTCHAAHGAYLSSIPSFPGQERFVPANGGASGYKTFFLRRTSPTDGFAALCQACHKKI
jgi:hypothetical protein